MITHVLFQTIQGCMNDERMRKCGEMENSIFFSSMFFSIIFWVKDHKKGIFVEYRYLDTYGMYIFNVYTQTYIQICKEGSLPEMCENIEK